MKKWRLTCSYMGKTVEQAVSEFDLHDRWSLVELGEYAGKIVGRQFEDGDGPKDVNDSPLTWKDGQATETGCGPWWGGAGRNTPAPYDTIVADCDALLVQAGLDPLAVVTTDGVRDLEAMFDTGGVNADALDALDRAEWTLDALPEAAPLE